MIVTERERERGRDIGRGRSRLMHREPDVGFDPGSPGSRPGPKAGAKLLRHPGIPPNTLYTTSDKALLRSFVPNYVRVT